MDPASLRGLGPDQVLVLVNGKRRYSSVAGEHQRHDRAAARWAPTSTRYRVASIKRIEVLRDGAAALYGSDAIAGVINIQLKDDTTGVTSISSLCGQTTQSDGRTDAGRCQRRHQPRTSAASWT
ncbi:MAG: TonB-dependent receptor plug domain-containing protein [Hymenobacter sp.]